MSRCETLNKQDRGFLAEGFTLCTLKYGGKVFCFKLSKPYNIVVLKETPNMEVVTTKQL